MELLSARGLTKYFPETRTLANAGVSLSLASGELHAIVGENGAGKSTLARMIAGLERPDSGYIEARGRRLRGGGVREAEAAGIGFAPQVSLLAPGLSVAENLALGREPRTAGIFFSARKAYVEAALLVERYGFQLDPSATVSALSAAQRRQADIARALARGGDILILDEPTSILSEQEARELFARLRTLADAGTAVAFITHRVSEVAALADRITVLREGRVAASIAAGEADERTITELMTRSAAGIAAMPRPAAKKPRGAGSPAFEIEGLRLAAGAPPFSIALGSGEIVAVTAFAGNGLAELEALASGMRESRDGRVRIAGVDIGTVSRGVLRSELLAYAPSDREGSGICCDASIRDNALALRMREFRALDWIGRSVREEAAMAALRAFGVERDASESAGSLSGGNRQRLLLARELDRPRAAALLAEPLQGLDIRSREEAISRIRSLADAGTAVLILTSNVEDALALADRVVALYRGRTALEAVASEAGIGDIVAFMAGGARGAA
jgi:general nucleoside transport system ATP-binding protein